MVTLEALRNAMMRWTELHASCSLCGWQNNGKPVRMITDAAMESLAGTASFDAVVSEALERARTFHLCTDVG
jgi:hypothetical protein